MSNRKTTKHALIVSFVALLLCFTMLLGTTFAWFTDEVTSANNIIKSGTLDAEMYYSEDNTTWLDASKGAIFNYDKWEPGYSELKYIKVSNVGDLAFEYQLNVKPATMESADGHNLAEVIDVYFALTSETGFTAPTAANKFGSLKKVGTLLDLMLDGDGAAHGILLPKNGSADVVAPGEKYETGEFTACIVLHMQEEAGNEYQNLWVGQEDKEKGFAVQLLANQYTYEKDSFDHEYDEDATTPVAGSATVKVDLTTTEAAYELVVPGTSGNSATLGGATVPKGAIADGSEEISLSIEKVALNGDVVITADQDAVTYEVTAKNLKENNTTPIPVYLYVGKGLTGVEVYHNDEKLTDSVYYSATGYVHFTTTSFSPFTVVYDAEAKEETPVVPDENNMPKAIVTNVDEEEGKAIAWGSYGSWSPSDPTQQLESAYLFVAPHDSETIDSCEYKDWYCDYVVSIDKDIEAGDIFLGGNYGPFEWIGFENPVDIAANEEIALLGSVTDNPWTYADIAVSVHEFLCGVAEANGGNNDLEGSTFTVKLRLTNPTDETEFYDVNTVEYVFGSHANI